MRTLADMTPEERQACVGMWCDFADFEASHILQTVGVQAPSLIRPLSGMRETLTYEHVTPRFDLPRAWMPDGTPVVMSQEVDYRLIPAEKNGGKYGHRKWVRYVSEWSPE